MKPTATSRVYGLLRACDDFRTARQLRGQLMGLTLNQVSAALYHLRNYKAADFIEAPETLWWFATPENDARSYKRKGITEHPITRPRKKGATRPAETRRRSARRYEL